MKHLLYFIILLAAIPSFGQKEASNWFFGQRAGIRFNDDGTVTPLSGSRMDTNEGCSSISDSNGNLLFYTDGRTVWDRNHVVMPNGDYFNGTGLLGDPSSTQSGIIIPKKNDPNIYYIFTIDEPHHLNASVYPARYTGTYPVGNTEERIPEADDGFNNGLNYSVVDLSVTGSNGSIGNITTRNVPLNTYDPSLPDEAKYRSSEKVTAVKNGNGSGFWIITHFIDRFYAFEVTAAGVNSTPVVTRIDPVVPVSGYRRNAIGCIKASPNGKYIAIAHNEMGTVTGETADNGAVYLYNFDKNTGVVSNPVAVMENVAPYGVEFSPEVKKLYVSYDSRNTSQGEVYQFNMESTDIANSGVRIAQGGTATTLQLGPDGKIYKARNGGTTLDVINNPELDGANCRYTYSGVSLPFGTNGVFGLPPFITSFFYATIIAEKTCVLQPVQFSIKSNKTYDSISWNFGDGSTEVTGNTPQHTYNTAGNYTVTATVTFDGETETITQDVTIVPQPVVNTPPALMGCDNDTDGLTTFKLSDNTTAILGSAQNANSFTVSYYISHTDAEANINPLNAASYTNTSNPQTIFARVINNSSPTCYSITSFELQTGIPASINNNTFYMCDDANDGDDTNKIATFKLDEIAAGLVSATGYTVSWHATSDDADNNTAALPQQFYTGDTTIYARIENTAYGCYTITNVILNVNALPVNVNNALLSQCDPKAAPDGITTFNLTQADVQFTTGSPAFAVTYHKTVSDAETQAIPLGDTYRNTTPFTEIIYARVANTGNGCYRIIPLTLQVTTANLPALALARCDDATEDGFTLFNLEEAGLENSIDSVVYYASEADALAEENAISSAFTNTTPYSQQVFARMENNNSCLAIRQINLNVWPLPPVGEDAEAIVCLNTKDFIVLSAGIRGSQYRYSWTTGAATNSISVNEPGIYAVTVTDTSHPELCSKTRTFTVTPSNVAQITDIMVDDLNNNENNTITIVAVPTGGVATTYLYSLDKPNGPWQETPYFENVERGLHTVYVYDTNGCGIVSKMVGVLGIPEYFTPNGDNTNDYWYIPGLGGSNYFGSMVYIYDRYGKLITSLTPKSKGWDGTLNGRQLPSTDYWYVLTLPDGSTVKGHFSLIR